MDEFSTRSWTTILHPNASMPESFGIPSTRKIESRFLLAGVGTRQRNSFFCRKQLINFCSSCRHASLREWDSAAETNQGVSARDRRIFLRHLHSRAQHAIADRQGRLVLPEELCRKIGLKDEVALVGNRGRFEIWNLQRWKRAHEEETATYQHVANVIGL